MFERIKDILPQFSAYIKLFPNDEKLRHAISEVYLDIIRFCTDAKNVFQKAKEKGGMWSPAIITPEQDLVCKTN